MQDINSVYLPLFLAKAGDHFPTDEHLATMLRRVSFNQILTITNYTLGTPVNPDQIVACTAEHVREITAPTLDLSIPYYHDLSRQLNRHLSLPASTQRNLRSTLLTVGAVTHSSWLAREPHVHNIMIAQDKPPNRFSPVMYLPFELMLVQDYASHRTNGASSLDSLIHTSLLVFKDLAINAY